MAAAPGRTIAIDTEYQRNGGFMICEPACGGDRAPHCRGLRAPDAVRCVDEAYPDAEVVRLVLDNLNTQSSARSTKHLSRSKLGHRPNASSFITLLRMAAG